MTITALPPAPSRAEPSTFSDRGDALLGALATFVSEANALGVALNLASTTSTSVTSLAIGIGSKALTVDASKSYQPGMSVKIAYTTDPKIWMHGDVTSYNAGTGALVVNVTETQGVGTYAAWTVTLSGPRGVGALAWSLITANPNPAVEDNGYLCNTTAGAFTVTLPAAPIVGNVLAIADAAGTFSTNSLTIGRNGLRIMALEEDMIVSTKYATFQLVYASAALGWRIV